MTRETFDAAASELRFVDDTGSIAGYAARFNQLNSLNETIVPGAFAASLKAHAAAGTTPRMFWSHDRHQPIGAWRSIREDEHGLLVQGRLTLSVRRAQEAADLIRDGAVDGLSIGFRAVREHRGPRGVRILTAIDIVEISLVSLPADPGARVTTRSAADPANLAAFLAACRTASASFKGV